MLPNVIHRDMSDIHVHTGDRAYLPGSSTFGDVTRDSVLGLKKGCIVKGDDGKLRALCGDMVTSVVNKVSGQDGNGTHVPLPTDLKVVGPQVLAKFGVGETEQSVLFSKFNALDPAVRQQKSALFEQHKDDDNKLGDFVTEIMDILKTDDLYIETHTEHVLSGVPDDIRATMMVNLSTATDSDARKNLMVQYHTVQNDRIQVEDFRQHLLSTLLDSTTYARLEITRCLLRERGADAAAVEQRVHNFIDTASAATIEKFVTEWRHLKYYRNSAKTFARRKALHFLRANEVQVENASA